MTNPDTQRVEKPSTFFAAVRARGMLNAMLDGPALEYERLHSDERVRWEYSPKDGDNTLVIAREGQGFHVVNHKDLIDPEVETTEHQKTEGAVRVGDLVLMTGPKDLVNLLDMEDAKAAFDDSQLPETVYREYIESLSVKTRSGTVVRGKSIGPGSKVSTEEFQVGLPVEEE